MIPDQVERRYWTITQVAQVVGVSPQTLRNWEDAVGIVPARISEANARRYTAKQVSDFAMMKEAQQFCHPPGLRALYRAKKLEAFLFLMRNQNKQKIKVPNQTESV